MAPTIGLLGLSLLLVYSTTAATALASGGYELAFIIKHAVSIGLGLVGFCLVQFVNLDKLRNLNKLLLLLTLFTLLLLFLPGVGHSAGGATRWIKFGPLQFQPSELFKLLAIVYFADYLGRKESGLETAKHGLVVPLVLIALVGAILLPQPDFGSTAIISSIIILQLAMLVPLRFLFSIGSLAGVAAASLILFSPYRLRRLLSFLDPLADKTDSGYQLSQSLVAIGSGGWLGVGLGAGQQKLFYLPAAHTDFIFSVLVEELGFLGVLVLLGLFAVIAWRGLSLVSHFKDNLFLASLSLGLTALLIVPAILNVAVATGMLPTKGLVLPFVSYGGSAMLVNLLTLGLLNRVARENRTM